MPIGPFRHLPARLRPKSVFQDREVPQCVQRLKSAIETCLECDGLSQERSKPLANDLSVGIILYEVSLGVVYRLGGGIEVVIFLDHSHLASSHYGVRVVGWREEDGFVASEIVSPW